MPTPTKDLSYYDGLPYACEFIESADGSVVAFHPELPGCATEGENVHAALAILAAARRLWLRARLADGGPVPEPVRREPSGRFIQRVPIRLHAQLNVLAASYGMSLNALLNELIFNYVNALPVDHGLGNRVDDAEALGGGEDPALAVRLTPDGEGGMVAEHPDLPGCFSAGDDVDEALAGLGAARDLWEESRREDGLSVPKPLSADHTGRIHVRMPRALHGLLAQDAQRNGTTLNQMLSVALAESVGRLAVEAEPQVWPVSHDVAIAKTVNELRVNPHRLDLDASVLGMPKSHLTFMRALACLEWEEREDRFDQIFGYVVAAYQQGLDFTNHAAHIFRTMQAAPEVKDFGNVAVFRPRRFPPDERKLLDQLFAATQDLKSSHPSRKLAQSLLMIFRYGVLREPGLQEIWRVEARKRTVPELRDLSGRESTSTGTDRH